jgi:hypothetical protein
MINEPGGTVCQQNQLIEQQNEWIKQLLLERDELRKKVGHTQTNGKVDGEGMREESDPSMENPFETLPEAPGGWERG